MIKKIIITVILSTTINAYHGNTIAEKTYNDYKTWESAYMQEINDQNAVTLVDEFKRQVVEQ